MSENNGQEKTEQATPKRLADARKKGQVPRSRELNTATVMLIATAGLFAFGDNLAVDTLEALRSGLALERGELFDLNAPIATFGEAIYTALKSLLPFFAVVLAAAICAPAMTGGWSFSTKAIAFKASKLNPIKGLKRVFSANGLLELVKALAKFAVVGGFAVVFLKLYALEFLALSTMPVRAALVEAAVLGVKALLMFSAPLLLIAAVDVPFQLWQHAKQLRMTRQEVRDEMKETDGNPELKSRIRQLQMEQANARMMEEVPTADVVITNPTHFAVALRYDPERHAAPRVVAKGADLVAARIRESAREHGVPLLSAPPLARALFRSCELNDEIPARLYSAVAQVLTWVFQVRHVQQHGGLEPDRPTVELDDEENNT
ncbi:MAG: flagellar biosynthesis protein FlhB [Pseudomonadota bacterium]